MIASACFSRDAFGQLEERAALPIRQALSQLGKPLPVLRRQHVVTGILSRLGNDATQVDVARSKNVDAPAVLLGPQEPRALV